MTTEMSLRKTSCLFTTSTLLLPDRSLLVTVLTDYDYDPEPLTMIVPAVLTSTGLSGELVGVLVIMTGLYPVAITTPSEITLSVMTGSTALPPALVGVKLTSRTGAPVFIVLAAYIAIYLALRVASSNGSSVGEVVS